MNAKEEFLNHIGYRKVKCSKIAFYSTTYNYLKLGYNEEQYEEFLKVIDVNYDNGYGGQELYGIIWYEDGTWSERGEYDGSEWWEYKSMPEIDKELTNNLKTKI